MKRSKNNKVNNLDANSGTLRTSILTFLLQEH